eukprot:6208962-Pleurochrysis_carterae.AAC.2
MELRDCLFLFLSALLPPDLNDRFVFAWARGSAVCVHVILERVRYLGRGAGVCMCASMCACFSALSRVCACAFACVRSCVRAYVCMRARARAWFLANV